MSNIAKDKGYTRIFDAFELKIASGSINGKLNIIFSVGATYMIRKEN